MEDLVACVGGPMDGFWFHRADWAERRASAERMAALNQPPAASLSYVETKDTTVNRLTSLPGTILRWTPTDIPA